MDENDALQISNQLNLKKAYDLDPQTFTNALQTAKALTERLPTPALFDEPSHVFPASGSLSQLAKDASVGGGND